MYKIVHIALLFAAEQRADNSAMPKLPHINDVLKELNNLAYGTFTSREYNMICSVMNFIERQLSA